MRVYGKRSQIFGHYFGNNLNGREKTDRDAIRGMRDHLVERHESITKERGKQEARNVFLQNERFHH